MERCKVASTAGVEPVVTNCPNAGMKGASVKRTPSPQATVVANKQSFTDSHGVTDHNL